MSRAPVCCPPPSPAALSHLPLLHPGPRRSRQCQWSSHHLHFQPSALLETVGKIGKIPSTTCRARPPLAPCGTQMGSYSKLLPFPNFVPHPTGLLPHCSCFPTGGNGPISEAATRPPRSQFLFLNLCLLPPCCICFSMNNYLCHDLGDQIIHYSKSNLF